MAQINKPNTFASGATISSSEFNDNFDTLYNEFNGSIDASNLASNAVTTAKVADDAVTTAKLADSSVTSEKLSSTVAFRATISGTTGNLAYGGSLTYTEVTDTGSDFSSGTFTAPYDGIYFFTVQGGINNHTGRFLTKITAGGSIVAEGFAFTSISNNDPIVTTSTVVALSASDTVTVDFGSETTGQTLNGSHFSGHLVGRT